MDGLTQRQAQVLDFIKRFKSLNGWPPTRNEIARHFGFRSANAAEEHLQALQRKQFISLDRNTARGIFVPD